MIQWKNIDQLTSFQKLQHINRINLAAAMTGEDGAERVKNYTVPMGEGLHFNYGARPVDDQILAALADLAKEAFKASELIKKHFDSAFGIDKKEIHVYHTESFGEYYGDGYLTIDGVFKYHDNWWGGREYQFACDADGIYRMLRSCYLRENNLEHLNNEKFECQIERVDGYFREFIEELIKDKQN